jgi:signal transduction histidine kinase
MSQQFLRATYGPASLKRVAYVACGLPLGAVGLMPVLVLLPALALSITVFGLVLVAAVVLAARPAGSLHRWLTRQLLGVVISSPAPIDRPPGSISWVQAGLTDSTGWRALLYLALKWPLSIIAFMPTAALLAWGLTLTSSPVWYGPAATRATGLDRGNVLTAWGFRFDTWPRVMLLSIIGIALLVTASWLSRVLIWPDIQLQKLLLGPTRTDGLRRARAAAVDDSAARLRRIERDLHDGAQAQLVAVAMKLSLAQDEMQHGEAEAARQLVATAHGDAQQALEELRDLARGIHPPALDRGLEPALRTLAARSSLPVRLEVALPTRPSPAIEAIAYYTAAELLTNVAKHANADSAALALAQSRPGWLRLTVHDNGTGGAAAAPGGGLAGLVDRVGTVDGYLHIASPPGGPTTITANLPERI